MSAPTKGAETAARLTNEKSGHDDFWKAGAFADDNTYDRQAFAALCDHLHTTLASDQTDAAKLAAVREYLEPVDPDLLIAREAAWSAFVGGKFFANKREAAEDVALRAIKLYRERTGQ